MPTLHMPGLVSLALALASAAATVACSSPPQDKPASDDEWQARVAAARAHAARQANPSPESPNTKRELGRDGDPSPPNAAPPPARSEAKAADTPTPGMPDVTIVTVPVSEKAAQARAREAVQVTMYSTSWCGVCTHARNYLRAKRVRFVEHDVERDPTARRRYLALNPKRSVPTITVDDQLMIGFDESSFDAMHDQAATARAANGAVSGPKIIEVSAQSAPRAPR